MKVLAIESSGMTASTAILDGDTIAARYSVCFKQTHSQTLLPMIDEVCSMIGLDKESLDVIAVSKGPGSFTGLRIGSATAKGIALALHKPVAEIPTLEAMAYRGWGFDGVICPMIDARNRQVFTGIYRFLPADGIMETLVDQEADAIEQIIDKLNNMNAPVMLLGDGAQKNRDILEADLKVPVLYAPGYMNMQDADTVAWLGRRYAEQGRLIDGSAHRPEYLRVSQAERERALREREMHHDA